jgi:hypothetical protein
MVTENERSTTILFSQHVPRQPRICFALLLCSAVLYMYLYTPLLAPTPNNLETVPHPAEDETERTMQIKLSNKKLPLESVVHGSWAENNCALYAQAPNLQFIMPRMTSNDGPSSKEVHAEGSLAHIFSTPPSLACTSISLLIQVDVDWIREISTVLFTLFLKQSIPGNNLKGLFHIDALLSARLEIGHLTTTLAVSMRPLLCNHPPIFPQIDLVPQDDEGKALRIAGACLNQELVAP